MIGTFLKGAVAGVVGLGVLSWLVSTFSQDETGEESDKEEE